jgi:hypothetical protein
MTIRAVVAMWLVAICAGPSPSVLENSELRAEHAVQRKLDAIAAALLVQREGKTTGAHDALEEAIGVHEEV